MTFEMTENNQKPKPAPVKYGIFTLVLVIIALLVYLGLKNYNPQINSVPQETQNNQITEVSQNQQKKQKKNMDPFAYYHPTVECEEGETKEFAIENSSQIAKFTCSGNMINVEGRNKTIKLNNGKILIYNTDAAEIFDPSTNTFSIIKSKYKEFSTENYDPSTKTFEKVIFRTNFPPFSDYLNKWLDTSKYKPVKISKNKYMIWVGIIYDEENNEVVEFTTKELSSYLHFIDSRKYSIEETRFIGTLNNKYFLYCNATKDESDIKEVWLEDPVNLTRSKYGNLSKTIKENTFFYNEDISAEIVDDNNILIFCRDLIQSFDPETGNVKKVLEINNENIRNPESLSLSKLSYLIKYIKYDGSKTYRFNSGSNKIEEINSGQIYSFKLIINDQNILVGGSKPLNILNPKTKSFKAINTNGYLEEVTGISFTLLDNNKILVLGGYEPGMGIQNPPVKYKQALLLTFEDKQ